MANKHVDCWNYQPIDVVKGVCLRTEEIIEWHGDTCPAFEAKPKCESCSHFSEPDEDNIGICQGLSDKSYWTLGARPATTCEGYES